MSAKVHQLRKFEDVSEKRLVDRLDLRPSDGIKALLRAHGQIYVCQVRDISPGGLCLVFPKISSPDLSSGEIHVIEITSHQKHKFELKVIVRWVAPLGGGYVRCGCTVDQGSTSSAEFDGLQIPEYYPLTGSIYKPYMFFERAPVRVLRIGREFWQIKIYDTEIFAFKGTELEVFLNTSNADQFATAFTVERVDNFDAEAVVLTVKPRNLSRPLQKWLARYLVFNLNVSPAEARSFNFDFKNLADGFRFRFIKTQADYEAVLQLRFRAYKAAGKVVEGKTYMDMQAPLDPVSRILGVFHGTKIIGSVSISFPADDMMLETETSMYGGYSVPMPKRSDVVEVARLCTDFDYRKTDLLVSIFEYIYKTLNCGDRKYVITSSDATLWPLYKKIGFKKTGMKYDHPYLAGLKHEVIMVKVTAGDIAKNISPLSWNYLYRDMANFLESTGVIKRSGVQKIKVKLIEFVGRILKIKRREKF